MGQLELDWIPDSGEDGRMTSEMVVCSFSGLDLEDELESGNGED